MAVVAAGHLRRGLDLVRLTGGVLAVVTVAGPLLGAEADGPTRLLLSAMHLVAGAAFVVSLGWAARRAVTGSAPAREAEPAPVSGHPAA